MQTWREKIGTFTGLKTMAAIKWQKQGLQALFQQPVTPTLYSQVPGTNMPVLREGAGEEGLRPGEINKLA